MNKVIKLVLIDVDGTLFGPSGVPQCAWEAAERARQAGLHLSICTGRPGRGFALEYAERLDPENFHIFESGAVIVSGHREVVRISALPVQSYQRLLSLSRLYEIPFEVYTAEGGFYRESQHPDLIAHESLLGFGAELRNLDAIPGQIIRVQFIPRPTSEWLVVREAIQNMPEVEIHEATSPGILGAGFNSVTAVGVSKRAAAEWVATQLGVDLCQSAMVGDGENDLELIRCAGLGIAMGNAPESVRQAADMVVDKVEDCGLKQALDIIRTHFIRK